MIINSHDFIMTKLSEKKCETIYHIICICAVLALTCWCLYKYILDEDVSLVGFETFNDNPNNIYPSITLCFWKIIPNIKMCSQIIF